VRRLPFIPVVLAGATAFLDLYATQPLLPMLAGAFDATPFHVGLTVTVPTVAVAIVAPFAGRLADAIGLRRVIVGSAALLTVATALAATSRSLNELLFWRLVQGILTPGVFASTVAYIHDLWPAERAGRVTAAYVSGTVVGGFIGRLVAGLVATHFDWHVSFLALAALNAVAALVLWRQLPDERAFGITPHSHVVHAPRGAARRLLRDGRLVAAFIVGFCVLFTQVAMFTYVTFHAAAPPFNLTTVALGWLFAVYLVGAIATPFAGHLVDAVGHRAGLASAMAIAGFGALVTLVPSLAAIVIGLALCATGVFIAQATTSSFIGAVTTRDRGLAIGMYSSLYYAGGSAGAALPALVWTRGGWLACVGLVVVVQAFATAVALTQWGKGSALSPEP
jgi:MFS family permease